jgi:hypothetical protein
VLSIPRTSCSGKSGAGDAFVPGTRALPFFFATSALLQVRPDDGGGTPP